MTLGEMKDIIANRLGDTSTNTGNRIVEFINDIMFRISDDIQYPGERRWGHLRTESGRFAYPLEPDVESIIEPMIIRDSNANIWMTPVETFNSNVQNPTSTGTPHNFMYYGNYTISRQPASKLEFTYTSLLTEITATIYGESDFRNISEDVTLAVGSTTTPSGANYIVTTEAFTTVSRVTLSAAPGVVVSVYGAGPSYAEGGEATVQGAKGPIVEFSATDTDSNTADWGLTNPGGTIRIRDDRFGVYANDRTFLIKGYSSAQVGNISGRGDYDRIYTEETITLAGGTAQTAIVTNGGTGNAITSANTTSITCSGASFGATDLWLGGRIWIKTTDGGTSYEYDRQVTASTGTVITFTPSIPVADPAIEAGDLYSLYPSKPFAESSKNFTSIESISGSAQNLSGAVFISTPVTKTEDTNGVQGYWDYSRLIGKMGATQTSEDIPIVGLYPIPSGQSVDYQYYRRLSAMISDTDRPPMDERVHRYIMKWAETAILAWYGESKGVTEVIQVSTPSWMQDMRAIRDILGLSANPEVVIGGRALNISRRYGATAMLDPAHYSN